MFKRRDRTDDPFGITIRPTSASGKLQTLVQNDVFATLRPATAAGSVTLADTQATDGTLTTRPVPPKSDRRLTLSEVHGIAAKSELLVRLNTPSSSLRRIKIEERITLDQLHKIKTAFEEADTDGSGSLDIDEFKGVVKKTLGVTGKNEEQIIALFMKIDSSSDGEIDWDEFCTYMQLEYAEKEEAVLRSKRVNFNLPAPTELTPHHKAPVLSILQVNDSMFMCTSQEGLFSFWSSELNLKRTRNIGSGYLSTSQLLKPSTWVTDVAMISSHNKIVVATGDREIHFYELSTFEFYCQITGLSTTPLRLDVQQVDSDQCIIMYGDDQGCVSILSLSTLSRTLRLWKKCPRVNNVPSIALQDVVAGDGITFVKWKVHEDWVTNVRYYHELRSVISSSNHTATALVRGCITASTTMDEMREITKAISGQAKLDTKIFKKNSLNAQKRQFADQSVFKVYKGVKAFDFSKERNILATGGIDRILRLWNPYMPQKPTARLQGHNAPILYLFIDDKDDRIFSMSGDNVMKVWDLVDHTCLVNLNPKLHKIRGEIFACMYSSVFKAVAIVTDHISLLKIKKNEIDLGSEFTKSRFKQVKMNEEMPVTHTEAITCCRYNKSFNHVVTSSDNGTVKLWDFETGYQMFEFDKTHGDSGILSMRFDASGRRLITAGGDGAVRIWNYNNGHCLKTLQKEGNTEEVTSVAYIEMNKNQFIMSVGWNRRICIFNDNPQDFRHYQRPQPYWPDDVMNGHTDDVIALAYGAPNLIATVAYDGLIIVWNIVSGHSMCRLRPPSLAKDESADDNITSEDEDSGHETNYDSDKAVNEVIFITSRVTKKTEAQLVAGCADGRLLFWCVHEPMLYGSCVATCDNSGVGAMAMSQDNSLLYVADQRGYVRVWDITRYARKPMKRNRPPQLEISWRAHIQGIVCLELVENHDIVLTGSSDHTLRMWTTTSEYIGTFGQSTPWDIHDRSTWKHPMVPPEVLFDPKSMPDHPIMNAKIDDSMDDDSEEDEVIEKDSKNKTGKPHVMIQAQPKSKRKSMHNRGDAWRAQLTRRLSRSALVTGPVDSEEDRQMFDEIRKSMDSGSGKRLRHEKLISRHRQMKLHQDVSAHAFQSLKCFDLVNASDLAGEAVKPNPREHIDDPFVTITEEMEEENT